MLSEKLISLVVPAYNEAECIGLGIARIQGVLEKVGQAFEIIVVDDGSHDATWEAIMASSKASKTVKGVRLSRNFGKEYAICAGLDAAMGDAVILLDADMQHPPELIPKMIERWSEGNVDVIEGVKVHRGKESIISKAIALIFYRIMGSLSGIDFSGASDFKLLDRKVVEAWKGMGERSVFFRGMSAWVGFRREQVEFEVAERGAGESKWSVWSLLALATGAITAFSTTPLRIITASGLIFFAFACVMGVNTMYQYFAGSAVTGFSTVILLLLIISSLVMLALGIIGEYIAKIYEEVKQRPRYIISERC